MSKLFERNFQPVECRSPSAERQHVLERRMIRQAQAVQARLSRAMIGHLLRALRRAMIRLATSLIVWWRAQAERRQRLRSMAQLQALSDHQLKDMGVNRSEIPWVVRYGRYEPPAGAFGKRRPGLATVTVLAKARRRAA